MHECKHLNSGTTYFLIAVAAAALSACGGGGGSGEITNGGGNNPPLISCQQGLKTGYASNIETTQPDSGNDGNGGASGEGGGAAAGGGLGKVLNARVTVTDLSDGSTIGSAITDGSDGLVTVKTCSKPGPFLVKLEGASGAKYFDEGKNALIDFPTGTVLHALVDRWNEHVGVSPASEAAYRYALNNFAADPAAIKAGSQPLRSSGSLVGLTAAQVVQANQIVIDQINIKFTTNYQVPSAKTLPKPIDSSSTSLNNTPYGRSAALNGGLARAAGFYNPDINTPALAIADQLAKDLTDGRIDGFALNGNAIAPSAQTVYNSNKFAESVQIAANDFTGQLGRSLQPEAVTLDSLASFEARNFTPEVGSSNPCKAFFDDIGLLSDGSVTVRRITANSNPGEFGRCLYPEAQPQKLTNFLTNFLTNVKQIAAGGSAAYAVKKDGSLWAWGFNYCGMIDPTASAPAFITQAVRIPGLSNVTDIAVSENRVLVRDSSGRVFTWGIDGTATVQKNSPGLATAPAGRRVCDYKVFTGFNVYETSMAYTSITQVTSLTDVVKLAIDDKSNFAITSEGRVFAWGSGKGGVLANGTSITSGGPIEVQTSGARTASAGQINGAFDIVTPTLIPGLIGVKDLIVYQGMVFALMADGTLKAWGEDIFGFTGDGSVHMSNLRPTQVAGISGIKTIIVQEPQRLALGFLMYSGQVQIWADNFPKQTRQTFTPPAPLRQFLAGNDDFYGFFSDNQVKPFALFDSKPIFRESDLTELYR